MKRKDLRLLVRKDLNDTVLPFKWADADINGWLDEAENEACRRARLIKDSTTDEVCEIQTGADSALYTLDPRIIFVRRVKSDRLSTVLTKIRLRDLDAYLPGWQDRTGEVTHFCLDYETGSLLTYKVPTASLLPVLTLTVVRLPLSPLVNDDAEPEINGRWHPSLRHWGVYRGYSLPDEEQYRPEKAADAMTSFERVFGKESSATDEQWINENHGYDADEGLF